jgi:wobble nucleotide-excising tRNase
VATPTIAKLRHLKNAGIFRDVAIDQCPHEFKKFNIVYGFNGCGKTTLCRLIESISELGLSPNLADGAEFSFTLADGAVASNAAPVNVASRFIAVFSEDFIERSLTWKSGSAKPIIYLGEEQAELARELAEAEATETELAPEQTLHAAEWAGAQKAVETHCRERARLIAEELNLGRRYTAPNLRQDYADATIGPSDKLDEAKKVALKEVLWRTGLPDKLPTLRSVAGGDELERHVQRVLAETVSEIAIEALQRRKDALQWVEQGLHLHDSERECLFCGNEFPEDRRHALRQALSGGFAKLTQSLDDTSRRVVSFREECLRLRGALQTPPEMLSEFRKEFSERAADGVSVIEFALSACGSWAKLIDKKRGNPDATVHVDGQLAALAWDAGIAAAIARLNEVVAKHNAFIENFQQEKAEASAKLKRHFLQDAKGGYQEQVEQERITKEAFDKTDIALAEARRRIAGLRARLKAHGPAAGQLNTLLKSYLGHDKITLKADDEGYHICRDGKASTKPLSEGEKTAVAFCYFITALTAEGRKISDTIIVVDDPISSLDTRAMSHVVGMIRRRFGGPAQLFVLTHNLDFMREMKKWLNSKRKTGEAAFLFIETTIDAAGSRNSRLVEMPALIREYESEYHYLFSLVHTLVKEPETAGGFLYLMPNAMRKVLEIFLAFKQPGYADLQGIEPILVSHPQLDADKVKAMERLVQAESHSQNIGDSVSFSAYTLEQISAAGETLLNLISVADSPHYARMIKLCGA